ncbi:MAG: pyridoxamine 5'-phosphate oxidase family protein [Oscillospiraceae bacterium]|nr:pyridoxamine 5'-phosphate oxidase family protein [Oscillospiraceae bacterium]
MEMRRKDREVTDINQIYDILSRCDTITLGMNGGTAPYVIPMTFGCSLSEGKITIYFHSALGGRKWEILNRDPNVCAEAHLYYQTVKTNGGITAKYESVIGTGTAEMITEKSEKVAAFQYMLDHYKHSGFPAESCKGLPNCAVFKVVLTEVSGKHNL